MAYSKDLTQRCLRLLRTCLRTFSAERPATTLALVISISVTVLPFVSAAALMPLTFILDLSNALSNKGLFYVVYTLMFQVTFLTIIIVILFVIAFTIATSATILHKLNIIANNFQNKAKST